MSKQSTAKRKNIIWVFGDQHRAQMLGCNGDPNVHTPNIDRLSNTGVNFHKAVAGFPLCCPFRGSLLTSRYPHEAVPGNDCQLPPELPTIATAFKENGYATAYFGKWHLDGATRDRQKHIVPEGRRGDFDKWIGYENNNSQWDCWVHGTGIEEPMRLQGYETDALSDIFIDHLREQADDRETGNDPKPFFAVLSVQPPHTPYVAPAEWMGQHTPAGVNLRPNVPRVPSIEPVSRRDLAGAAGMVENLDWNLGRIITELEMTGLADDTYIVFFSDHGDMHGSHGQFRKSVPWEESIRIPFIVGGGGGMATRNRERPPAVINHVDIAPTTLGLCGIDKPSWMRGFDYSGMVRGDRPCDSPPDSAYLQVLDKGHGPSSYVSTANWRAIVTTDNWKYACLPNQPWLMYDLNDDPYEQVNLALSGKHRQKRKELHDRLSEWITTTGDAFDLPSI